jgi:RNA polymerase sigma-70 factor (ECF subfamily)
LRDRVAAALRALPDSQRSAVLLCHYQGFRNAEAAEVLGVSVEAVESLLARARRTLQARLRDLAPELLGG